MTFIYWLSDTFPVLFATGAVVLTMVAALSVAARFSAGE